MINIPAILIANGMGLAILFVIAVGNIWRLKESSKENRCILIMFFCCISNCISDPICFIADGKEGWLCRILVIGCNSLLYLGGALIALEWIFLVASRLQTELSRPHRTILLSLFGIMIVLVTINFFVPVLFSVDENNVYERCLGYWFYIVCYAIFMLDGLILYLRQRHASGGLKFFPAWAFILPAFVGLLVQSVFYGISVVTPFTTVSMVCLILCLQNEFMLRDKLTGLYNRFYLNTVEKRLKRYPNLRYSAIFLDINGFKMINDTYGHNVGDQTLIRLASVLLESVGRIGEVVRYAGDEFIIVVNSQDEACLEGVISEIQGRLEQFNREGGAPYHISVAMGYCRLDLKESTMDACLDKIDGLMYENKQEYYRSHPRYDRRGGKADKKD